MPRLLRHQAKSPVSQRGNLVVILAFVLTGVFAIAGLAIDTSLYLLKRQQVQTLAESVALASALYIPNVDQMEQIAPEWFDTLRVQDGSEIAPALSDDPSALVVTIDSNKDSANNDVPLVVNSISIQVRSSYLPNILKVPGLSYLPITVVGSAKAQLAPTDVTLVVENSASFYQLVEDNSASEPFLDPYGPKLSRRYWSQCFNPTYVAFKKGVLQLFDQLSQVGTFRVSVVMTNSKSEAAYVLANFGETTITGSKLEYDGDQPDYPSTRCAIGTTAGHNPVPLNPNSGGTWDPRTDLTGILVDHDSGNFDIAADTKLLTREALWIQQAGYSTSSGGKTFSIHPKHYYTDPRDALNLADSLMATVTRPDSLPVSQHVILWLTDGLGVVKKQDNGTEINVTPGEMCDHIKQVGFSTRQKIGILYYGHSEDYFYHSWDENDSQSGAEEMRENCIEPGTSNSGIVFVENSPFNNRGTEDFPDETARLVAFSLKQAELVE